MLITIAKAEPIMSIGGGYIGKIHLLTGPFAATCPRKWVVRFASAARLIREMVTAMHQLLLRRAVTVCTVPPGRI